MAEFAIESPLTFIFCVNQTLLDLGRTFKRNVRTTIGTNQKCFVSFSSQLFLPDRHILPRSNGLPNKQMIGTQSSRGWSAAILFPALRSMNWKCGRPTLSIYRRLIGSLAGPSLWE